VLLGSSIALHVTDSLDDFSLWELLLHESILANKIIWWLITGNTAIIKRHRRFFVLLCGAFDSKKSLSCSMLCTVAPRHDVREDDSQIQKPHRLVVDEPINP
jgi:hypothetical protein